MPDFTFRALAQGPLGFPMPDRAAREVDQLLRGLPKTKEYEYRHLVLARGLSELNPGERSDVSWISTESVDRAGEVVRALGMNDAAFAANPLVTLGHRYDLPPAGRSLWRKRARDGALRGVKAKTQYPPRPESWPAGEPWLPDQVFALVQSGLLRGKSIGFLPTKVHVPDADEARRHGWGDGVRLVVDEWLLLEYACVTLPANQDALVEAVSKGGPGRATAFTPLTEVEKAVRRGLEALDLGDLARRAVREALDRARGRV